MPLLGLDAEQHGGVHAEKLRAPLERLPEADGQRRGVGREVPKEPRVVHLDARRARVDEGRGQQAGLRQRRLAHRLARERQQHMAVVTQPCGADVRGREPELGARGRQDVLIREHVEGHPGLGLASGVAYGAHDADASVHFLTNDEESVGTENGGRLPESDVESRARRGRHEGQRRESPEAGIGWGPRGYRASTCA